MTLSRRALRGAALTAIVAAALLVSGGNAAAHERRVIGAYGFQVGWVNEPAYVGQLNSIELHVVDTKTSTPVTGLEKTLTVELRAGGLAPVKLDLEPAEDPTSGYVGWVVPTVTGGYAFHIVGKVGTQNVDETFASGPNTFDDVADVAALQYPTNIPAGDELKKTLDAISSGVDQTRIIAVAALAIGLLALATSLLRGKSRA